MISQQLTRAGTCYGVLLNFRSEVEAWRTRMNKAPYKGAPKAPILYVKTANTVSPHGASIGVPAHVPQVQCGATIGMLIGPLAPTVPAARRIAGYVLMNDFSVPHESYFRPPVKYKCLDGFLGVGAYLVRPPLAGDPSRFELEVRVNGELRQTVRFDELVRPAGELVNAVSEFMTLRPGDILMMGCDHGSPLLKVGDSVDISAPALRGMGILSNTLVAEVIPPVRRSAPARGAAV